MKILEDIRNLLLQEESNTSLVEHLPECSRQQSLQVHHRGRFSMGTGGGYPVAHGDYDRTQLICPECGESNDL